METNQDFHKDAIPLRPNRLSPTTPQPSPPGPSVVISPCAACKILRRRCDVDKCVLAPYFPPTEPSKFTIAHRVFGAANIMKLLQELPESRRADAVSSLVYEASARVRDPVYGCAGAISQLQNQVTELQAQLARAQAEIVNMQCQNASLFGLPCTEAADEPDQGRHRSSMPMAAAHHQHHQFHSTMMDSSGFVDESISSLVSSSWEPLWT